MKNESKRKLLLLLAFLLFSIVFHTAVILVFFSYDYRHQVMHHLSSLAHIFESSDVEKKDTLHTQQKREKLINALQALKKKKHNELPAKLRAPKSSFGWVMFEDPPSKPAEKKQLEIPTTLDGDIGKATHAQATEEKPEPVVQPKQQSIKNQTAHTSHAKRPTAQHLNKVAQKQRFKVAKQKPLPMAPTSIEQPVTTPPQTSEIAAGATNTTDIEQPQTQPQQLSIEERIEHIRNIQNKMETFQAGVTPAQQKNPFARSSKSQEEGATDAVQQEDRLIGGPGGIRVRGARSNDSKQKRSVIALTKGFVEKLYGEEGTDLIDRDGDPNKRPSFEELKYLSYEAKINWCLQSSWKQNFGRRTMGKYPARMEAIIEFTLDENGNVINSALLQSTGYQDIDTMVMNNMTCASPFPPLPKHFETKTYVTGRIIHIYSESANF